MDRITIALEDTVGTAVREAASSAGMSVSAWMADAAAMRLRNQLLGEALDQYEAEHGAFTDAELAAAADVFARRPGRFRAE